MTSAMHISDDGPGPGAARSCLLLSAHTGPDFAIGAAAALLDTSTSAAGDLIAPLAGVAW